jgi:RNA polymerase sigma-70 factor (ECF subfamily)
VAVSWSDSGARTGPHEISLIAKIAARNDDDAVRRLYRKYRMELYRFGVHVLRDQGLAEEMVQETFIKLCQQARNYDASRGPVRGWLFTMACSAAYDIARRPSSRPLLPVEDFQLPPQYDSVDQALTILTVDQALDMMSAIYGDVMRLVRDGFTQSEIAGRLGIPIGTIKSRMAMAADTLRAELADPEAATILSGRDIELAHPEAFDFVFGNLPQAKRADFNRHLGGCRYCPAVVGKYSEIGRIIQLLPPHVEPSADLEDRTGAAMVAALTEQRAKTGRGSDAGDQAATPGLSGSRGPSAG